MAELNLKIRYDSYQSLLQLKDILDLAFKSGFRKCQITQSFSTETKDKMLTHETVKFLEKKCFEIKFNLLKISLGNIQQTSFYKIIDNMKNSPFITTLSLANNELTDTSIIHLCKFSFKFLAMLDLSHNKLTSNSVKALSKCKWKHLKSFSISKNKLGNKGITYLAKAEWQKLKYLSLQCVSMTNDGIKSLMKGCWPQLLCLTLRQNHINNQGFKLLNHSNWSKLSFLSIKNNYLSLKAFINNNQKCKLSINSKERLIIQSNISEFYQKYK